MSEINISALHSVARKLDTLDLNYAFLGGSIASLLLDELQLSPIRATDDVDVIVEVLTSQRYSDIEKRLRDGGFEHDVRDNASICRWLLNRITVDIMPVDGAFMGLNTAWFPEALSSATLREIDQRQLMIVSPVAFLATKLAAFHDRGRGDYYASHDLEDLVAVIDGRAAIVEEISTSADPMRRFVVESISRLCEKSDFREAVPGFLPSDAASQQRLPSLRRKTEEIARLAT